jgi:hypothetical protein
MIFAREIDDSLTSLVKKLDKATADNKSCRMGSFVVFLSNEEGLEQKLKDLVKKANLKNTVLTIDNVSGPRGYGIAKEADVKSGPQVGSRRITPFHPLNINGSQAGKKNCLV